MILKVEFTYISGDQYEKQAYGTLINSLRKTPRRLTKSNTKLRMIADLHTHTKQYLINKLFTYISLSRNFVIEVYHALFLHLKLKFEITVISFNSRLKGWKDKDCGTNQKNVLKNFFRYLFEDKQFFLFLCLGTNKILSLGEFDELKSHLFLVHFSA